jgi:hypothetical protein
MGDARGFANWGSTRRKVFTICWIGVAGGAVTAVWMVGKDTILDIYASIAVVFVLARILDLPSSSWWGTGRLDAAKNAWGSRKLRHAYNPADPIRKLADVPGAKPYFAASVYNENTKKLCNTYQDGLPLRILGALLGALLFYMKSKGAAPPRGDELTTAFNYFGALAPALLALTWDYSRFERQRTWNRELQEP